MMFLIVFLQNRPPSAGGRVKCMEMCFQNRPRDRVKCMADLLISVWALYLLYIMGVAGGNLCILIFNIFKYKIGDRISVFLRKIRLRWKFPLQKKHYEFCPADACPAESQISRGGGRRNAEPDV